MRTSSSGREGIKEELNSERNERMKNPQQRISVEDDPLGLISSLNFEIKNLRLVAAGILKANYLTVALQANVRRP